MTLTVLVITLQAATTASVPSDTKAMALNVSTSMNATQIATEARQSSATTATYMQPATTLSDHLNVTATPVIWTRLD